MSIVTIKHKKSHTLLGKGHSRRYLMKNKTITANSMTPLEHSDKDRESIASEAYTLAQTSKKIKTVEISVASLKQDFGVNSLKVLNEIASFGLKGFPYYASNADGAAEMLLESIQEMNPTDALEAKLYAKEASLYSLAMQYVRRAEAGMFNEDSDLASRMWYETNMNYAIKLLRLHNETIETLNRYRRKGEQKVAVQHAQINDGGKAIVGNNLAMGGVGNCKKRARIPHGYSTQVPSKSKTIRQALR
jgi:hypothetical protein